MIYTFEARKEIILDCHDKGISVIDVRSAYDDGGEYHICFEWDRVPVLIETLKAMHAQWSKEDEA